MKKLLSALISAAFLATPMMVISTPAAAQSVAPTTTASSFKFEAKRGGKKMKRAKGAKKAM
jgi:Ni/Co efflux regulator RcnB